MADQLSAAHPHRLKMDGSSDSICLNCLATLTPNHNSDQKESIRIHICHPSFTSKRSTDMHV
jgi:hypothetical protein